MARIIYAKLDKLWDKRKLYSKIENRADKKFIVIPKRQYRKLWRGMVNTGRVKGRDPNTKLEKLWAVFNMDSNPLGSPVGQELIDRKGVGHTSMSIGDMVKLGNKHYVASHVGWTRVRFRR